MIHFLPSLMPNRAISSFCNKLSINNYLFDSGKNLSTVPFLYFPRIQPSQPLPRAGLYAFSLVPTEQPFSGLSLLSVPESAHQFFLSSPPS